MMHYLMIPYPIARDDRLGLEDLLVYGAICGLGDNRPPPPELPPLTIDDVVRWTNLEKNRIGVALDRLVAFGWATKDGGGYSLVEPEFEFGRVIVDGLDEEAVG